MTIDQFRSDPMAFEAWAEVLKMPITQIVLRTLRDNGPEFRAQGGLTQTDASIRLGHICGYAEHHAHLEDMGERLPLKNVAPPATYEDPEQEE